MPRLDQLSLSRLNHLWTAGEGQPHRMEGVAACPLAGNAASKEGTRCCHSSTGASRCSPETRTGLQVHLRDTVQARRLLPDGSYERLSAQPGDTPLSSQAWMLQRWSSRPVAETRVEV